MDLAAKIYPINSILPKSTAVKTKLLSTIPIYRPALSIPGFFSEFRLPENPLHMTPVKNPPPNVSLGHCREFFLQDCVDLSSLLRGVSLWSNDVTCHGGHDSFHYIVSNYISNRVYLCSTPYIGCIPLSSPNISCCLSILFQDERCFLGLAHSLLRIGFLIGLPNKFYPFPRSWLNYIRNEKLCKNKALLRDNGTICRTLPNSLTSFLNIEISVPLTFQLSWGPSFLP